MLKTVMVIKQKLKFVILTAFGLAFVLLVHRKVYRQSSILLHLEVVDTLQGMRLSEGQFVGQFHYARYVPGVYGSLSNERKKRIRKLEEEVRVNQALIQDHAVLALASGDSTLALDLLNFALSKNPRDANLLSDISAVYLARNKLLGDSANLLDALHAAEKALEINPELNSARFNKAVSLYELFLLTEAKEEFEAYIHSSSDSGWSREAQSKISIIKRHNPDALRSLYVRKLDDAILSGNVSILKRVVSQNPQVAREHGEEMLGKWALSVLGRSRLNSKIESEALVNIGTAIADHNHDYMLLDTVRAIAANSLGPLGKLSTIAQGHLEFLRGKNLYEEFKIDQAEQSLTRAEQELAEVNSPYAEWARFFLILVSYQRGRYDLALSGASLLYENLNKNRYKILSARVLWVIGLINYIKANPSVALSSYLASLEIFQQSGEVGNAAVMHELVSESYDFLGETGEAWRHIYTALSASGEVLEYKRLHAIFQHAASMCMERNDPLSALYFQSEVIRRVGELGVNESLAIALGLRAGINKEAGRLRESLHDMESAREYAEKVSDKRVRLVVLGDMDLLGGELEIAESPQAAISMLDRAYSEYRATDYLRYLPRLYLARSHAHWKNGNTILARSDIWSGIEEIERERASMSSFELRSSFWNTMAKLFDAALEVEVVRDRNWSVGFEVVERSRARSLSDLISTSYGTRDHLNSRRPVISLDEVQRSIPDGVSLIEYSVLSDSLLSWVVNRKTVTTLAQSVGKGYLESLVLKLKNGIDSNGEVDPVTLAKLYDLLIRPAEGALAGSHTIVVVPDEFLYGVPFAMLRPSQSDKYLVESFRISIAPSASIFIRSIGRYHMLEHSRLKKVLIVGNPLFSRKRYYDLSDLSSSMEEALAVAKLYRNAELLTGSAATAEAVLGKLKEADIMHFAGHAVVNARVPMLSGLVLAPGTGDSEGEGLLARDLYKQRLVHTRLVVLSACGTATSERVGLEGVESLARPFLAAGVPSVIGSLWDVGDRNSAEFFTQLHARLSKGQAVLEAFRTAQLKALSKDRSLRSAKLWAAFEAFGGVAPN